MSGARQRWLDEGVEVLAEEGGVDAVRIDRLARRVGLSTGSFYHHFQGAAGFKRDLLAYLVRQQLDAFSQVIHGEITEEKRSAREVFSSLIARVGSAQGELRRPRLEIALRAWALTDADAARAQAAIDEGRMTLIRSVWRQVTDDEEELRLAALLPYVITIGASAIIPPLSNDDLQKLYERIFPLIPDDLATGPEDEDAP